MISFPKISTGIIIQTRNKHRISQIDGNNDDSELEDIIAKYLTLKCEYYEYTTRKKQDLLKHAKKTHHQCAEGCLDLPSKASFNHHRKEKHC